MRVLSLTVAMKQNEFKAFIKNQRNPYEGANTSNEILEIISEALEKGIEMKKEFYDMGE